LLEIRLRTILSLCIFFLNIGFVIIFNFFFINLSRSYNPGHESRMSFFNIRFFRVVLLCLIFQDIMLIHLEFNFIYVYLLSYEFFRLWIYLLLILINKFGKYNQVNVSFYVVEYLDLYLSLNFINFYFSYC